MGVPHKERGRRMDEMLDAYDVFARPAETGALKVLLTR